MCYNDWTYGESQTRGVYVNNLVQTHTRIAMGTLQKLQTSLSLQQSPTFLFLPNSNDKLSPIHVVLSDFYNRKTADSQNGYNQQNTIQVLIDKWNLSSILNVNARSVCNKMDDVT